MASIKISNLYPAGSELFKDSESFMTELFDNDLISSNGGIGIVNYSPWCYPTITIYSPKCKPSVRCTIHTTLPIPTIPTVG
ncbi:hypothetical protein H6G96_27405 [Nostoc sp. FACHB-892]|uniref:hypothetical protein n=1 Tax=Nostoc sp. FACHB-892 TaxID=2692843 RepID=UPI0016829E5D|nr:hypothetical protein [Nostoc sp. FACHB-892]MBD2729946.1 hypothetical protein [Nostoc sp. FACHB-892]